MQMKENKDSWGNLYASVKIYSRQNLTALKMVYPVFLLERFLFFFFAYTLRN